MSYPTIQYAVAGYLLGKSYLTALVGTRIQPPPAPDPPTWPILFYRLDSDEPVHDMAGALDSADAKIKLTCWAETPEHAADVIECVRDAADGLSSQTLTIAGGGGSFWVQSCFFSRNDENPVGSPEIEALRMWGQSCELTLYYALGLPTH